MFDSKSIKLFADRFIFWLLIRYVNEGNESQFLDLIKYTYAAAEDINLINIILENKSQKVNEKWQELFDIEERPELKKIEDVKQILDNIKLILHWKHSWTRDQSPMKATLLRVAVETGYIHGFKALAAELQNSNSNKLHEYFLLALKNKRIEIIKYCIANFPQLENEILDPFGSTPVKLAIKEDDIDLISCFRKIEHGSQESWEKFINRSFPEGGKLLLFAIKNGTVNFIEFLIKNKINFTFFSDNSLLREAINSEKVLMVELILLQCPNVSTYGIVSGVISNINSLARNRRVIENRERIIELEAILKLILATKKINASDLSNLEIKLLKKLIQKKIISSDENIKHILLKENNPNRFYVVTALIAGVSFFSFLGEIFFLATGDQPTNGFGLLVGGVIITGVILIASVSAFFNSSRILRFLSDFKQFWSALVRRLNGRYTYEFDIESQIGNEVENIVKEDEEQDFTYITRTLSAQRTEKPTILQSGQVEQTSFLTELHEYIKTLINELEKKTLYKESRVNIKIEFLKNTLEELKNPAEIKYQLQWILDSFLQESTPDEIKDFIKTKRAELKKIFDSHCPEITSEISTNCHDNKLLGELEKNDAAKIAISLDELMRKVTQIEEQAKEAKETEEDFQKNEETPSKGEIILELNL